MIIPSNKIGDLGLVQDLQDYKVLPGGWTTADNIRFTDGYAEKISGHSQFVSTSVTPYFLLPLQRTSVNYWIYTGLSKIYATDGTNQINLTRQTAAVDVNYVGGIDDTWTGDTLNGIPVLCNGVDTPQMLYPVSIGNRVEELTAWPSDTTASVVKAYKSYLVALDLYQGGDRFPYKVKTSHQADPGTPPSSWDHTDPTKDATENTLSKGGGFIVDGGVLDDTFIIYREDSIYEMRFIGGRFLFAYREINNEMGLYAKRCFIEYPGGHCFLSNTDIMVHDGKTFVSIGDARQKKTLFTALNAATNNKRTFLAHNKTETEVWICYPTGSNAAPNKAIIWNYTENTFTNRDLPNTTYIEYGIIENSVDPTWDATTTTWDATTTRWDNRLYDPSKKSILMATTGNTLLKGDDTNQFSGVSYTATLERTGMTVFGQDQQPTVDLQSIKTIKQVIPKISAASGTVINIKTGYQMTPGASVTWGTTQTYTVGTDYKVDVMSTGRLLAIHFQTTGNVAWKLDGFDADVIIEGKQ